MTAWLAVTIFSGFPGPVFAEAKLPHNLFKCETSWFATANNGAGTQSVNEFEVGRVALNAPYPDEFVNQSDDAASFEGALSNYFHDAAIFYESLNLDPPVLNCTTDNGKFTAIIVFDIGNTLGDYTPDCRNTGGSVTQGRSYERAIRLNDTLLRKEIDPTTKEGDPIFEGQYDGLDFKIPFHARVPAHELFHAVFANSEMGKTRCGYIGDWVTEGLAEAFAILWLENAGGNIGITASKSRAGRDFTIPLHIPFPVIPEGEPDFGDKGHRYGTWWFWKFLGDQYDKNPHDRKIDAGDPAKFNAALVEDYINFRSAQACNETPMAMTEPHWELDWLDKVLKCWVNDFGGPRQNLVEGGLYVVYPRFSTWLLHEFRNNEAGFKVTFGGGCETVFLKLAHPSELRMDIQQIAGKCVKVVLDPLKISKSFFVRMHSTSDTADQIHVGSALRVLEPFRTGSNGEWKTWSVYAGDEQQVFLSISNVKKIALETLPKSDLVFIFDYQGAGEVN